MAQQESAVSYEGVLALAQALKVNKTLQYLNLVSCRVVVFIAMFLGDAAAPLFALVFLSSVFNVPGKLFDVSL